MAHNPQAPGKRAGGSGLSTHPDPAIREPLARVWLCDCCLIMLANQDQSGHDDGCDNSHSAPMSAWDGGTLAPSDGVDSEDTLDFSRRPCLGCGTHLAGRRTAAFEVG